MYLQVWLVIIIILKDAKMAKMAKMTKYSGVDLEYVKISAHADGGPSSRFGARETLRSADPSKWAEIFRQACL